MERPRLVFPLRGQRTRRALALVLELVVAGAGGAAALTAAPAPAAAQPPAAAAEPSQADRVRELFLKGRAEYARDLLPQAYEHFTEAWRLQKSFDIAGNLALVESQLTRYREAAEHATYALATFPAGGSANQRKALLDVLAKARPFIGAITVRVSADHAAVSVDGHPAGDSPLDAEIFVEPGTHTFAASLPGCDPTQDSVTATRGGSHLLTLNFTHCGSRTVPPPLQPLVPVAPPPRPLTVAGFITFGVGMGLGAAFAILSKVKASAADSTAQTIESATANNPGACAGKLTATLLVDCSNLSGQRSSQTTFANAAFWSFIAGGVVGAGTLVYALVVPVSPASPASPDGKAPRAQLIPLVGPGTGGVLLKGAF